MDRSRWLIVWLLAFSLGLNVMFVGMGVASRTNKTAPPAKPVDAAQKWTYTNLFPMDDPDMNLTPEQKTKLQSIRREIDTAELRLNNQTADRVIRWFKVLNGNDLTSQTVDPFVVEMCQGTADLQRRLVRSITAQRAVLTPEQNRLFAERLRKQLTDTQALSQKRLNNTKTRMAEKYGVPFVRDILGPATTVTLERKN